MQKAREILTHLGEEDRATLASGLSMYMSAIGELQRLNLAAGLELLKNAESQLSGTANPSLRYMLDHFAPEALFAAGAIALANLDLNKAQVLITDAAGRTEIVAKVYHDDDPSTKSWFFGLADLYRAYLGMSQLIQNLGAFDVEGLDQTNELGLTAQHARELLLRGEAPESIKQTLCGFASATSAVIDAVLVAAPVVDAMLKRKLPPAVDFVGSQNRLKQAKKAAAAGGESNLPLVRLCERLGSTMGNLQRYVHNFPPRRSLDPVRLFVMQPFNDETKIVEDALRAIFENEPYWFQIILARDRTIALNLFENVKRHMDLVDGFVADISDLNANVMLELGMTESDLQERPVFILRRAQAKEPPADLKQKLYVEYDLPPNGAKDAFEVLAAQLGGKLQSIDAVNQLLRGRRSRYLSTRYVDTQCKRYHLSLDRQEKNRLRREFLTVEELQARTVDEIAQRTDFDRHWPV